MAGFYISRQRCAGAGGTAGADQTMQAMLDHQRCDRRDLDHLMTQWIWINTVQQLTAVAARIRVVIHHLFHPLDRQQLWSGSGMACLSAPLAATALAPLWRLKAKPATGGRLLLRRSLAARRSCGSSGQSALAGWPVLSPGAVSWQRSSSFSCLRALISSC